MLQLPTIFLLVAFSFLAVMHFIALQLFLYWRYWWFDIPMHLLGGAVVALGIFTLVDLRIFPQSVLRIGVVMLLVMLVAVIWEVYEVAIGVPIDGDYAIDTATDLIMGFFGSIIGFLVGTSIRKI